LLCPERAKYIILQKFMENFIVSARKYRPATFDTVIGQAPITTTLKNAIKSQHLAQAFLFCGPRGVGKTTCARILAKTINCVNISEDTEACNQCESCISFNNGQSLNIYELDAASNNSVEDIRNLVEQVRFPPHGGRYKIYIIDEVHMLSTNAFNAFLKTLEEPPPYAIFILATTEKHKIIPTILSRCQIFDFSRIQVTDIASHLASIAKKEEINAEPAGLHIIAQKADGALRDALSMFDQIVSFSGAHLTYKAVIQNLNILDYDYYFKITDFLLGRDYSNAFLVFNEILQHGFDGHLFINGLSAHIRDLLVSKDTITLELLEVTDSIKAKYAHQSGTADAGLLMEWLSITNQSDVSYKLAKNQRLHIELALLKMCRAGIASPVVSFQAQSAVASPSTRVNPVPAAEVKAPAKEQVPGDVKEVAPVPPPSPKSVPPAAGIFRISDELSSDQKKKRTELSEEAILVNSGPDIPFSGEDLNKAWHRYAVEAEKKGKIRLAAILKRDLLLLENNVLELSVPQIEANELKDEKTDLLEFLRKELNNQSISLITTVTKAARTEAEIPYTAEEKYNHMLAKNPALGEMKSKLGLDIEY
jgi:DNA polymerase-3 subunit gamma/tau